MHPQLWWLELASLRSQFAGSAVDSATRIRPQRSAGWAGDRTLVSPGLGLAPDSGGQWSSEPVNKLANRIKRVAIGRNSFRRHGIPLRALLSASST